MDDIQGLPFHLFGSNANDDTHFFQRQLASEEIERSRKRNQKDGLNQNDITEGRSEIQKHIEIY